MKRAALSFVLVAAVSAAEPPATVGDANLPRYAGQWHGVAKNPNRFHGPCIGDTTATYRLRDGGDVSLSPEDRRAVEDRLPAHGYAAARVVNSPHEKN